MLRITGLMAAFAAFASAAQATPILSEVEPCEEKVLITRKATPRASPAKPSPIIAWVTVRSGRPQVAGRACTDETFILDLPEPELIGFEPATWYDPLEWTEEPEPIEWEPYGPRWYWHWWDIPRIVVIRQPPSGDRPPDGDEGPPPPVSVPEPATWALMSLGLLGLGIRRRAA